MARLKFTLLGSPIVYAGQQPLAFPTRHALALLVYLLVEGGTHRRDKLAAIFWPQHAAGQGRAVLRTTLARLRKVLGEQHDLVITPDTLSFDFAIPFDLDLHVLQSATQTLRLSGPPAEILQQAVDLYRGDFLEGFSVPNAPNFDDWVMFQREAWHYRVGLVFDRLSQWQAEAGEIRTAIETVRRWLNHHPFDENAHHRLIQLHFTAGDRAAALQAYETGRLILKNEVGVAPTVEMEALVERVREGLTIPGDLSTAQKSISPALVDPAAKITTLKWLDLPLVGRANEHIQLVAAYSQACRGQLQVILLTGEAGVGKTRLAQEFLRWAMSQGADVLHGRAFETGGRLPYQSLIQALRPRLEQENAPDDLLADIWLSELSRLLPELRERYPDLPAPTGADAATQARLFEAVARLIEALAQHRPVILFIDDLQWIDTTTLDLLQYALQRWYDNTALLLLLSLRQETLDKDNSAFSASDWLINLERQHTLNRLTLAPLSAEEIRRLVQLLAGSEAEKIEPADKPASTPVQIATLAHWLYQETGGQPFFITETLKVLMDRRLFIAQPQPESGWFIDFSGIERWLQTEEASALIPPGVQNLIRARLARLSPAAFALLAAGAVLGQGLEFERMRQVAGLGEDEGLQALDEILAGQLLQPITQQRLPRYSFNFSHDKIRDVVYAEVGDVRRTVFHRRAFEALQAAASPAVLAHHALPAGLVEAAFQFSLAAGDEALRLFATGDAIKHYQQAQLLLGDEVVLTHLQQQIPHLYSQLGRAYELNNQFEAAQTIYEAMLAWAEAQQQPGLACEALNRLAGVAAFHKVDLERAAQLLQQALQLAESSGSKARLAETAWNLAQLNFYNMDAETTLAQARQALSLARELQLQELAGRSLNVIAYAEILRGQWPAVERPAGEGQVIFAGLGNRAMEVDCLCQVTIGRINSGQLQAGIQAGRRAHAISLEIENVWGQIHSAVQLVPGLLDVGEYGQALAQAQQSVSLAQRDQIDFLLPLCLLRLGAVYRTLLTLEMAQKTLLEAKTANERNPAQPFAAAIAAELGTVCALNGAWAEAANYAAQVRQAQKQALLYTGFDGWFEIEAFLRNVQPEKAQERLNHFKEGTAHNPRRRLAYLRALAVVAEGQNETVKARTHLEEAQRLAGEMDLLGEQWQILAALAELHRATGETTQARAAYSQAAEILHQLAGQIDDEQLRTEFLAAKPIRHILAERA